MNDKSELSIFCENVKYLRAVNKLSKSEMAKKLGISVASLSSIENGNVPPRLSCDVIFYIHHNFGIRPSDIFAPFSNR